MLVDCNKQALPEEIICRITHSSDLSDKELLEDDSKSELLLNELLVYDLPSIPRSFPRCSRSFCIESQPNFWEEKFFSVPARIPFEREENGHLFRALCQISVCMTIRSSYPKIS